MFTTGCVIITLSVRGWCKEYIKCKWFDFVPHRAVTGSN